MTLLTSPALDETALLNMMPHCIEETDFPYQKIHSGKVRDIYECDNHLLLASTDKVSAFDRPIALIPKKGEVLNLLSAWWFQKTAHLVPNHFIKLHTARSMIVKKCRIFPVEFVVRAYITGSTNTSLWTQYQKGSRQYCGIHFPDGLVKNQKLAQPVLTPTTKDKIHDEPISRDEILARQLMSAEEWQTVSHYALTLFQFASELAQQKGLILVDTKYEFGVDETGNILLVDELHTPDSSRYWNKNTYFSRFSAGLEPESSDKEFLRLWFAANANPYHDAVLPAAPKELIATLASRYIHLYERLTGFTFQLKE